MHHPRVVHDLFPGAVYQISEAMQGGGRISASRQSEPVSGQRIHNYGFNSLWPTNMEPDWTLVWEEKQFKGEKKTAVALSLDEVQHPLWPGGGPWKAESVSIGQFPCLLDSREEIIDLITPRNQFVRSEAASDWNIFSDQRIIICHLSVDPFLWEVYTPFNRRDDGYSLCPSRRQCRT